MTEAIKGQRANRKAKGRKGIIQRTVNGRGRNMEQRKRRAADVFNSFPKSYILSADKKRDNKNGRRGEKRKKRGQ